MLINEHYDCDCELLCASWYGFHNWKPKQFNPLDSEGNYSATSNNTKLVHWLLMGGLLHLVQWRGAWAGCGTAQSPRFLLDHAVDLHNFWTWKIVVEEEGTLWLWVEASNTQSGGRRSSSQSCTAVYRPWASCSHISARFLLHHREHK